MSLDGTRLRDAMDAGVAAADEGYADSDTRADIKENFLGPLADAIAEETNDHVDSGGGGGAVDDFNGRTGSITPQAADYDSFFLTPAEGNAAYQPLDSDLTALAALSATGAWVKRTGAATYIVSTPTASDVGADPSGTAAAAVAAHEALSDPHPGYLTPTEGDAAYQPLDADLTAIAALSATGGYAKRTAANTWSIATPSASDVGAVPTGRTLTGTAPIRIDGGASADLSADRTISISAATTSAKGSVELATDGESAADVVVQGDDRRLAYALWAAMGAC